MLALVNHFLDFSKIDSGSLTLETVAFDLPELVAQAMGVVAPTAQAKALLVHVEVTLDRGYRLGDPTRLRQLLLNLLGNAVKFTTTGSPAIAPLPQPANLADLHGLRVLVVDVDELRRGSHGLPDYCAHTGAQRGKRTRAETDKVAT